MQLSCWYKKNKKENYDDPNARGDGCLRFDGKL